MYIQNVNQGPLFSPSLYRNLEFYKSKSGEGFPKRYNGFRERQNIVAQNKKTADLKCQIFDSQLFLVINAIFM